MFVNGVEICKFKGKECEINAAPLCLGNVSKVFQLLTQKRLNYMDTYIIF